MSARTRTPPAAAALALAALLAVAFVAAATADLAPWLRGPAPYPPEWQWEYRRPPAAAPKAALALVLLTALLVAGSGTDAIRRRERQAARVLVAAAALLGFALPLALLAREPAGALRTLLARTTSFSVTSYHTAALSEEARAPLAFVQRHAELLPRLAAGAKHAATHPPWPVLYFRAANAACERWPALGDALLALAGVPERDFAPPLTRSARAGALLGALGLSLLAAATAWPLAALCLALGQSPLVAARAALLWTLVPGAALVAPRFDAAIAFPVTAYALFVVRAARGRRRLLAAATAGACAALALSLSYGAAVFLAVAGAAAAAAVLTPAARSAPDEVPRLRARTLLALAVSAAVALLLVFGLPALAGGHPLDSLRTALAIHHHEYTAPRRYALWLLFDPVDFAAFVGIPVATLAAAAALAAARAPRRAQAASLFALATVAGIALLVAAGVARGEVGRLWIPLMPPLVVGALAAAEDARRSTIVALLTAACTLAIAAAWRV